MATQRFVTGGFFIECPDCGSHRYATATGWKCACPGDESIIVDRDIQLDSHEEKDTRPDETGRPALYVITYDEYDDDDEETGR